MRKALLLLGLVAGAWPAVSLAQNNWTIAHQSGVAVMNEMSPVYFTVTNSAGSPSVISSVTLKVRSQDYDIQGGLAPPGWVVSAVSRGDRAVTFTISGGCPSGLAAGASAVFGIQLEGLAAASDQTDAFITSGNPTTSAQGCPSNVNFNSPTLTNASWKRVGLSAALSASPRTLEVGDSTTLTLTVTNRSSGTQSNITAPYPTRTGSALFTNTSGPTPSSLSLASGASGTFTWTYQAASNGIASFSVAASSGSSTTTSNTSTTLLLNVGIFPAAVAISPYEITTGSQVTANETLTVSLMVSNNTTDTLTNVVPNPLTTAGTATFTLASGPTPASVATLTPGSTTQFTWSYTVSGGPGATFQFVGQASAMRNGLPISSDPVGSATGYVVSHTVRPNPKAVMSGATNQTIAYQVNNGGTLAVTKVFILEPGAPFTVSGTQPAAPTGWTASTPGGNPKGRLFTANTGVNIPVGGNQSFSIAYSSVATVTSNTTYAHRFILTQSDTTEVRTEGSVTVFINSPPTAVSSLVGLASPAKVQLNWTNPANHDGVLVLRSTGTTAPNTAPTSGTTYTAGQTIGNATVMYFDTLSFSSSFTDTSVTNGTNYIYKVYNHDQYNVYSSGDIPTTAGISGAPTPGTLRTPLWCYNVGAQVGLQPSIELGTTVYSSNMTGSVTANVSSTNSSTNGSERWRPARLVGNVQSRMLAVPLANRSGTYLLVGDQSGYAYALDASTGSPIWPTVNGAGNAGGPIGTRIQAQPAAQLRSRSNAAFQAAHPADLLFYATADTATHTNNRVWALNSTDGSQRWVYNPADLDWVNGGMLVDYTNNRLWVAALSTSGQASLRVINTLNGAEVARASLGSISHPVAWGFATSEVYITTDAGTVYAFPLTFTPPTLTASWSYVTGAQSNYAFPTNEGFIASLANSVQRYSVNPTTKVVTPIWATPPAVTAPSGVRVEYASQKIFVGDNAGNLHQIDVTTGAIDTTVSVGTAALATPTIDPNFTPKRLYVGGSDGRLCTYAVPFQ